MAFFFNAGKNRYRNSWSGALKQNSCCYSCESVSVEFEISVYCGSASLWAIMARQVQRQSSSVLSSRKWDGASQYNILSVPVWCAVLPLSLTPKSSTSSLCIYGNKNKPQFALCKQTITESFCIYSHLGRKSNANMKCWLSIYSNVQMFVLFIYF